MDQLIINRVALSGLITLDLEQYYQPHERIAFDLTDFLSEGIILKEKLFRDKVSEFNWEYYSNKNVAIFCSQDVIIPHWAYMIVVNRLSFVTSNVIVGSLLELENYLFIKILLGIDLSQFKNKKVVVKGCSSLKVPSIAYSEVTRLLTPLVSSLLFGEPCSTVPIFKKKIN